MAILPHHETFTSPLLLIPTRPSPFDYTPIPCKVHSGKLVLDKILPLVFAQQLIKHIKLSLHFRIMVKYFVIYKRGGFPLIEKIETGGAGCGTVLIDQSILLKFTFLFLPHCSDFCD